MFEISDAAIRVEMLAKEGSVARKSFIHAALRVLGRLGVSNTGGYQKI